MAESSDSGSSWPGLLSELTKGFLILRDVFGYALPGAVFLGMGLICRRFSLADIRYYVLNGYHPPGWLSAIVALGACYVIGHVMAVLAYLPYNWKRANLVSLLQKLKDLVRKINTKLEEMERHGSRNGAEDSNKEDQAEIIRLLQEMKKLLEQLVEMQTKAGPQNSAGKNIDNDYSELIRIRAERPEFLIEFDRQSTMTMLRGSAGAALLLGAIFFWWLPNTPQLGWFSAWAGGLLLLLFWFSAMPHTDKLRNSTVEAAAQSEADAKPASGTSSLKQVLDDTVKILSAVRDKL